MGMNRSWEDLFSMPHDVYMDIEMRLEQPKKRKRKKLTPEQLKERRERKLAAKREQAPKLAPKLQRAVELLAAGMTAREAAKELGVYDSQVRKWMNHPDFEANMEAQGMKYSRKTGWQAKKNPRYKSPPHPPGMAEQAVRSAGFHSIKYKGRKNTKAGPIQAFTGTDYQDGRTYLLGVGRPYGDAISVRVLAEERKGPKQLKLFKNPRGSDTYDPREEQIRAQRQAIYETSLSRTERKPFRDKRGKRLDAKVIAQGDLDWIREFITNKMFRMGTGVQSRDRRLKAGTQTPTRKAILEAKKRYSDVDKLLRNRQDYEESLGIMRKSGFYRVQKEATRSGWKYYVWPMKPGQKIPKGYKSPRAAEREAERLNATADPVRHAERSGIVATKKWWTPPKKKYTKRELADWLPPADVWR